MMMCFSEYVKENRWEFCAGVEEICNDLGIEMVWLMFVMYFESKLNPKSVNPISGATGLMQFMPKTARSLGTTTEDLKNMSNLEQLKFVHAYLRRHKGKMKSWIDVYLAVFYPVAMGKGDSYTITRRIVAEQNPIFDLNGDKKIEVREIKEALRKRIPSKYKSLFD